MNKEVYTLKEIEEKLEHEKYLRKENQELYEELQVLRKCSDTTNDLANEYKKELDKYKNIIDEALGIANERINYYAHKQIEAEDWSEIFNVLIKRDNQELKGSDK